MELLVYNIIQQFFGQPQCNQSFILNETSVPTRLCWSAAWIFRFLYGFLVSWFLIFCYAATVLFFIIVKAIMESSDLYKDIQDSLTTFNDDNNTTWTFPF